jgi:hypothetical protein
MAGIKTVLLIILIVAVIFAYLYIFHPSYIGKKSTTTTVLPSNNTITNAFNNYTTTAEKEFNVSNSSVVSILPNKEPYLLNNVLESNPNPILIINYTYNGKIYQLPQWFSLSFSNVTANLPNFNGQHVQFLFFMNKTAAINYTGNPANSTPMIFNYSVAVNGTTYKFTFINNKNNKIISVLSIPFNKHQVFYTIGFEYNKTIYLIPDIAIG